jgi:hypothetical protein
MNNSSLDVRSVLGWVTMLLLAATIGSLSLPGFNSLTLKLGAAALLAIILWLIYPKGKSRQ